MHNIISVSCKEHHTVAAFADVCRLVGRQVVPEVLQLFARC